MHFSISSFATLLYNIYNINSFLRTKIIQPGVLILFGNDIL